MKRTWTNSEIDYLKENYPDTLNPELSAALGRSIPSIQGMARKYGLKKSQKVIDHVQRMATNAARQVNILFGYSDERKRMLVEAGRNTRFKKGQKVTFSEQSMRKRVESYKRSFNSDKRRVLFGLPQKTKMKVTKKPRALNMLKYKMRKNGYVFPESGRSAYYDENTKRLPVSEKHIIEKFGYKIYEAQVRL